MAMEQANLIIRDDGKEDGNYYGLNRDYIWGLYSRDNGKENGNY